MTYRRPAYVWIMAILAALVCVFGGVCAAWLASPAKLVSKPLWQPYQKGFPTSWDHKLQCKQEDAKDPYRLIPDRFVWIRSRLQGEGPPSYLLGTDASFTVSASKANAGTHSYWRDVASGKGPLACLRYIAYDAEGKPLQRKYCEMTFDLQTLELRTHDAEGVVTQGLCRMLSSPTTKE